MAYTDTRIGDESPHTPSVGAGVSEREKRLSGVQSREILAGHLDRLLIQLDRPEAAVDTTSARETLMDLSADIVSRTSIFRNSDYRWLLDRLTGVYGQGFGRRVQEPLVATAAAYGQVIETISNACPDQDYREAVGQLFCYMSRLFRNREDSWKLVYRHILAIPDAVAAKQLLNRALFVEIREWAEAGVDNLFSIRRDLYERIAAQTTRIEDLDRRILDLTRGLRHHRRATAASAGSNVIDLQEVRDKRLITTLEHERRGLMEDREGEKAVVALVESDIREFEEMLRSTRRAYFVRTV